MVKKTFDYKDAEEKLVNCTILYSNDFQLCYDAEFQNIVPSEDYVDLFLAGVVILDDGEYLRPDRCDGMNMYWSTNAYNANVGGK